MKVHAYASWRHYADHIVPIWRALPLEHRGQFVVTSPNLVAYLASRNVAAVLPRENGEKAQALQTREPIMVAAYSDLRKMRRRPVVFVEHGAGQTYKKDDGSIHGGYSGGENRDNVELFLCPNKTVAAANLAAYPQARTIVCGSPRLDDLVLQRAMKKQTNDLVVGITFHWDCRIVPEAGTAFPHFAKQIKTFVRMAQACGINVIGHGHPKNWEFYKDWWDQCGVPTEKNWLHLAGQIDLLVADNSSTIFEAAALNIPVVLLQSPRWRRNVEHGLRFWEHANVGPSILPGEDLAAAINEAFDERWEHQRREVSRAVYNIGPHLAANATRTAVEGVLEMLETKGE